MSTLGLSDGAFLVSSKRLKVALVVMPWIDAAICPLGVASLKAHLQSRGVETDVHYLHLRMADRIGLKLYATLSRNPELWPDWFFAYHLFGPGGTGELKGKFEDVAARPSFKSFIARSRVPRSRWEALLLDDVPAFLEECLAEIPWRQYDLVGFSSTMYSHAACLKLAKGIKERFGRTIAFGGPNVEGEMGRATIEGCGWIDYVVDGEGEEALLSIVESLGTPGLPGERVTQRTKAGAIVSNEKKPAVLDMSSLPLPDHDDFFKTWRSCRNLADLPVTVTFESSRGCWWGQKQHCTFCGIPDAALVYRVKPAALAASQIWELHRRYQTSRLYATDLIMSLDHIEKLLPALTELRRRDDSDLRIFYETKSNLTRGQIEAFSRAGVCELLAGIESLSSDTLRLMRKGVRAIQNIQTLKWGQACGIKIVWNYLYGFPGENREEYAKAADAILSLTHLQPPSGFGPVRPDRSSPYHERPQDFGLKRPRPDKVYPFLYPRTRFDLNRIAYTFEFAPGDAAARMGPRLAAFAERLRFWDEVWPNNFFASRRGAESVELFDTRPLREGGGMRLREHTLTGLEAFVYRRCETIQTLGEVVAASRQRDPSAEAGEISAILDGMVERRWLWREENLYLSLAVPLTGLPVAQRYCLEALQAAGRNAAL
ncbi:MAG TPA: RiPP maturation radical SAM C-methyltransferase, partial [Elusimicrobiota bacterium]|nr:RiPP maturation radical SAM C-methyltransferase [Elusimicrobiota bacterium]